MNAVISCCLVRLSTGGSGPPGEIVSLPACMQRSIRRGAASASRLDPLAFSGDKRGRSKALFHAVLDGTSISDTEPLKFSCDPEKAGLTAKLPPRQPQERSSPLASASLLVLQLYRCSIGFPHVWRATLVNHEDSDALGDFAVTHQQWRACVRRMLRCKLACTLPSLDPRFASGALAVAKDEDRDRFIGDVSGGRTCLAAHDSDV